MFIWTKAIHNLLHFVWFIAGRTENMETCTMLAITYRLVQASDRKLQNIFAQAIDFDSTPIRFGTTYTAQIASRFFYPQMYKHTYITLNVDLVVIKAESK